MTTRAEEIARDEVWRACAAAPLFSPGWRPPTWFQRAADRYAAEERERLMVMIGRLLDNGSPSRYDANQYLAAWGDLEAERAEHDRRRSEVKP